MKVFVAVPGQPNAEVFKDFLMSYNYHTHGFGDECYSLIKLSSLQALFELKEFLPPELEIVIGWDMQDQELRKIAPYEIIIFNREEHVV